MEEEIPFNKWSKERIEQGKKVCTSRHHRYTHDKRVIIIVARNWGQIRDTMWDLEGADSAEELQKVIEDIYKRKVHDDERFWVHFGNFKGAK